MQPRERREWVSITNGIECLDIFKQQSSHCLKQDAVLFFTHFPRRMTAVNHPICRRNDTVSSLTLSIRHLQPRAEHWDWQLRGRCRDLDTDVFFSPDSEGRGARVRRERAAKEICDQCPVQRTCRNHALSVGERYGVWGGTSEADRRYLDAPEPAVRRPAPKQQMQISPRYRHFISR
nr:hypothetical protein GCM10017611_47920 [Rhodococcus wratislaviensis]